METSELQVRTGTELVVDVTAAVERAISAWGRGGLDGLCHIFLPHATAGLALIEVGSGSDEDLRDAVDRLLPRSSPYRHRHGSPGHGADHLLPAFVCPSLVLAVVAGELVLGTWQRLVVVDPNVDNEERTLLLHFLTDGA